ncbi:MAG: shikimate dehydrogenase [Muribaculaceae bacterium]|jgi:shikimate dehydrogenase|nr:shikimate dehydrogenase [Muribaculaceae bacterium]MEE1337466.1 shikimate dehydrogenase [Muribaculaceae bacterium]
MKGTLYGLLGYPLGHSFSRNYFNNKFEAEDIDAEYINFEIPDINMLMEVISEYYNLNGLNVTIPYKEQVIPFLDELDEDAANIGAVNVIKIIHKNNDLILKGYNSDVVGFCDSISPLIKPHMKKALILGTGGAAKAVCYGLKKLGIESQFVSRKKTENTITYPEINKDIIDEHHIIVNTTPLGMYPNVDDCPDIPYELLTEKHLCYDLLYNPDETLFMKNAKGYGATVKNGLEMLLLQAFVSYEIWNS